MTGVTGRRQDKYLVFNQALKDLHKAIKAGAGHRLYFIWGENDFVVQKTATYIFNLLKDNSENSLRTDFEELKDDDFHDLFQQDTLFGESQVVWVNRCELKATRFESLLKSLEKRESRDSVIFTYQKSRLTKGLLTVLAELGAQQIECVLPPSNKMNQYIIQSAKNKGLKLNERGATMLRESMGDNLILLENELNTLSLIYVDKNIELGPDEIAAHCSLLREDVIFRLNDLLLENKVGKAEALAYKLIREGQQPISVIGVLAKHIRQVLHCKTHPNQPIPGVPPFVQDRYRRFSAQVTIAQLLQGLHRCQSADMTYKSSLSSSGILGEIFDTFKSARQIRS